MQLLSEELKAFEEERARRDLERGSLLFETLLQRKIVTDKEKVLHRHHHCHPHH